MKEKLNRLTWHRKENKTNKHPKYLKDISRELYENGFWNEDDFFEYLTNVNREIVHTHNSQMEAIAIMEAIDFFKHGRYSERKEYLKELRDGKGASFNGFIFQKELWCWLVWKPTDMDEQPQFKGESLVKIIPDNVEIEKIPDVLDAQAWTYI